MKSLRATILGAVFGALYRLDALYDAASRRVRRPLGLVGPPRVLPYRGFGNPGRALVKARVIEDRHAPPPEGRKGLLRTLAASYRRYATRELAGVPVRVRWGARAWEGVTDEEGFLDLWVEPPPGVAAGWHAPVVEVEGAPPVEAPVFVVGPGADLGVVSDVDDTVIATGVRNVLRRAWALFLTDHRARLPFEGVGAFYRALQAGGTGGAENPVVYISSSPWNLYEHLDAFMRAHAIPAGPILLRDWGLRRDGFAPGGGHGHKLEKIRLVLATFPDLRFVLVGDSGQEDAEHYASVVREHPGRVLGIYIRCVPHRRGREVELERLARDVAEHGSVLVTVRDTEEAARDAAARGWIRREEAPSPGDARAR